MKRSEVCVKLSLKMLSKQFVFLLFVLLDGSKLMQSRARFDSSVIFVTVLSFSFCSCNQYTTLFAREQPKVLTRQKIVCVFLLKNLR